MAVTGLSASPGRRLAAHAIDASILMLLYASAPLLSRYWASRATEPTLVFSQTGSLGWDMLWASGQGNSGLTGMVYLVELLASPRRITTDDVFGLALLELILSSIAGIYYVLFTSWSGAAPGQHLLGLKVVGVGGDRIGFVRAVVRWLGMHLSSLPLFGGFLVAIWRDDRRTFHDMISGTVVVQRTRGDSALTVLRSVGILVTLLPLAAWPGFWRDETFGRDPFEGRAHEQFLVERHAAMVRAIHDYRTFTGGWPSSLELRWPLVRFYPGSPHPDLQHHGHPRDPEEQSGTIPLTPGGYLDIKRLPDSGGWLYDPATGFLILDCTHTCRTVPYRPLALNFFDQCRRISAEVRKGRTMPSLRAQLGNMDFLTADVEVPHGNFLWSEICQALRSEIAKVRDLRERFECIGIANRIAGAYGGNESDVVLDPGKVVGEYLTQTRALKAAKDRVQRYGALLDAWGWMYPSMADAWVAKTWIEIVVESAPDLRIAGAGLTMDDLHRMLGKPEGKYQIDLSGDGQPESFVTLGGYGFYGFNLCFGVIDGKPDVVRFGNNWSTSLVTTYWVKDSNQTCALWISAGGNGLASYGYSLVGMKDGRLAELDSVDVARGESIWFGDVEGDGVLEVWISDQQWYKWDGAGLKRQSVPLRSMKNFSRWGGGD